MPMPLKKMVRCEAVNELTATGDGGTTRGLKYAERITLIDPAPQDDQSRLLPGLGGSLTLTFRDAGDWGSFTPGVWYTLTFDEAAKVGAAPTPTPMPPTSNQGNSGKGGV